MKRLSFLLLFGAACNYHAFTQVFFAPNATPVSTTMFNPVSPGDQPINLFVWLPENNRIWFDLYQLKDLSKVPDLDQLFRQTNELISPLLDSFKADGLVRKIEVDATSTPFKFRVVSNNFQSETYTSQSGELVKLKVDQDTIRIKFLTTEKGSSFVNLLLNNASDIQTLESGTGLKALQLVKEGVEKNYKIDQTYKPRFQFYGSWNLETGKLVSPDNDHAIKAGNDYLEIGLINPSLTFARGQAFSALSIGASLNFSTRNSSKGSTHSFGVDWQPMFSFRTEAGKVNTFRNDFLVFSYEKILREPKPYFTFLNKFSVGYLIRNKGDFFEKNTYKVGLLGITNGRLQFEPEFYFNDFLKNVSPGIRMTLRLTK